MKKLTHLAQRCECVFSTQVFPPYSKTFLVARFPEKSRFSPPRQPKASVPTLDESFVMSLFTFLLIIIQVYL